MCIENCAEPDYITIDGKKQRVCGRHWIKETKSSATKCEFCGRALVVRRRGAGAKRRFCESLDCGKLRSNWRADEYRKRNKK